MQNAHLSALAAKHASLDRRIIAESQRPAPDQMILADLKRRKLKLKEEIALSCRATPGCPAPAGRPLGAGAIEVKRNAAQVCGSTPKNMRFREVRRAAAMADRLAR